MALYPSSSLFPSSGLLPDQSPSAPYIHHDGALSGTPLTFAGDSPSVENVSDGSFTALLTQGTPVTVEASGTPSTQPTEGVVVQYTADGTVLS